MYEINGEVEGFAISGMMIDRRIKQSRARLYNYQEKPLKHQKRSPKADRVVTSLETQWELVLKAMVKVAVKVTKDKLVTCNCRGESWRTTWAGHAHSLLEAFAPGCTLQGKQ